MLYRGVLVIIDFEGEPGPRSSAAQAVPCGTCRHARSSTKRQAPAQRVPAGRCARFRGRVIPGARWNLATPRYSAATCHRKDAAPPASRKSWPDCALLSRKALRSLQLNTGRPGSHPAARILQLMEVEVTRRSHRFSRSPITTCTFSRGTTIASTTSWAPTSSRWPGRGNVFAVWLPRRRSPSWASERGQAQPWPSRAFLPLDVCSGVAIARVQVPRRIAISRLPRGQADPFAFFAEVPPSVPACVRRPPWADAAGGDRARRSPSRRVSTYEFTSLVARVPKRQPLPHLRDMARSWSTLATAHPRELMPIAEHPFRSWGTVPVISRPQPLRPPTSSVLARSQACRGDPGLVLHFPPTSWPGYSREPTPPSTRTCGRVPPG